MTADEFIQSLYRTCSKCLGNKAETDCPRCGGTGEELTKAGWRLVDFVRRHLEKPQREPEEFDPLERIYPVLSEEDKDVAIREFKKILAWEQQLQERREKDQKADP